MLIIKCHATILALFGERINSFHIGLKQVVFVLNFVLDDVLELLHLDLDDNLVHVRVATLTLANGRRSCFFIIYHRGCHSLLHRVCTFLEAFLKCIRLNCIIWAFSVVKTASSALIKIEHGHASRLFCLLYKSVS